MIFAAAIIAAVALTLLRLPFALLREAERQSRLRKQHRR